MFGQPSDTHTRKKGRSCNSDGAQFPVSAAIPSLRLNFICFSICSMSSPKRITCWIKVSPDTHVVIKWATVDHAAYLDPSCTVRLPGILLWFVEGRGAFRAGPYGEHMWAQESKLCHNRTPLAKVSGPILLIRSVQHVHHMWISSSNQNKPSWSQKLTTTRCAFVRESVQQSFSFPFFFFLKWRCGWFRDTGKAGSIIVMRFLL